jgi:CheY-specific phosphatase CheX
MKNYSIFLLKKKLQSGKKLHNFESMANSGIQELRNCHVGKDQESYARASRI